MKSITYNFSDFVKSGTVRPKSCDVNRIIFESINIMSDLSKHKNIDIMFDGIKDSGVVWDTDKIRQALVNFIKNSIEAIDIDDEEKNITITVKENQFKKGYIDINILDNGCGIPKHIKDKVFNSFVTSKEGGTGIGMTICDKIISSHGGEITIVDSNSNGTNLLITLPRFFVQEGGKFHG
ncbi:Sensor protein FixL [compost metagenome]